jgi:hypothetical protein
MATKHNINTHPDMEEEEGPYPLGLTKPLDQLTHQEIEAIGRRHNVWTRGKMRRFLCALSETGSVSAAAAEVGMSRQSAYRLRARLSGEPFDGAWKTALEFGLQQLAHAALDRALNGVEEDVWYHGEVVGKRVRHDTHLTMFLLANPRRDDRDPKRGNITPGLWNAMLEVIEHGPLTWEELDKLNFDTESGRAKL